VVDRATPAIAPYGPVVRAHGSAISTATRSRPTPRCPYAEAIFDRVSVEIARGCTEGCRFCQAGMIYRPVRERDPDSIIETCSRRRRQGRLRRGPA
jgi:radical SAM superfamily enzyme YgiQ (UPF0313 family)